MSVIVSRSAGFCWGVRRAVDLVLAELKSGEGPFSVYGQLVHNPQVIEALRKRGVDICEDPAKMSGGTLFLRTHGIPLNEHRSLGDLPIAVRDLTCPRVRRALTLAAEKSGEGYDLVILGDEGHREVTALKSYAGKGAVVISGPSDVDGLGELARPFLLSQTTQSTRTFDDTLRAMKKRFHNLEHANTICGSTEERQSELRALCPRADCAVVVGGRNSANTGRLLQIAREEGLPAVQVETYEELNPEDFRGCHRILLTAGASTPGWSIRKVRERLYEIQGSRARMGALRTLVRNTVFGSAHIPLVAAAIAFAGSRVLGGSGWLLGGVAAGLTLYVLHVLNSVMETGVCRLTCEKRQEYVAARKRILLGSAFLALGGALASAVAAGVIWVAAVALSLLLFLLYSLPALRGPGGRPVGLRAIPGARDVLFSTAWAFLLALLPGVLARPVVPLGAVVCWSIALFSLFLGRSLLVDLVDLQGDALMGMDTIPLKLGRNRSRKLLYVSLLAATLSMLVGVVLEVLPICSASFAVAPAWLLAGYRTVRSTPFPSELSARTASDGALLASGLVPGIVCLLLG
ncbi:4-hydroxy-3-methylbut-2-enyl diphosphate reductase [Candidatus Fermentibacteria bacterium]|nr:4-hydroxy-3-methylbut-2-enyl diphosphate reductase [Candidatus Fermentibacteria bacterium]